MIPEVTYFLTPAGLPGMSEVNRLGQRIVSISNPPFDIIRGRDGVRLGPLKVGYQIIKKETYERMIAEAQAERDVKRTRSAEQKTAYLVDMAAKKKLAKQFLIDSGMPADLADAAVK